MLKRPMAAVALVAALALGAAACGGTTKNSTANDGGNAATSGKKADPNAPIKQNLKLAFLPKQVNNPYETIVDNAGIAAAKGFYAQAKEVGPSDASASSQISYLNTLIQQRQDAILIAANDPNAVCGPLKQAMSRKIADSPVVFSRRSTTIVSYLIATARQPAMYSRSTFRIASTVSRTSRSP